MGEPFSSRIEETGSCSLNFWNQEHWLNYLQLDSEVDETTKVDDVVGCSDSSSDDEQSDSDENDEKDTVVDAENTEEDDASDNNDDGDDELPAEDYREGGFVEDIEEEQVGSIQNESGLHIKLFILLYSFFRRFLPLLNCDVFVSRLYALLIDSHFWYANLGRVV